MKNISKTHPHVNIIKLIASILIWSYTIIYDAYTSEHKFSISKKSNLAELMADFSKAVCSAKEYHDQFNSKDSEFLVSKFIKINAVEKFIRINAVPKFIKINHSSLKFWNRGKKVKEFSL